MSKIVIIDDSPEDREWLTGLVEQIGGYEVTSFAKMDPALEYLSENNVSVILLDFRLDAEMGIVYAGAIRSRAPNTRIIIVTGQEFPGLSSICSVFGAGFLTKQELTADRLRVAISFA